VRRTRRLLRRLTTFSYRYQVGKRLAFQRQTGGDDDDDDKDDVEKPVVVRWNLIKKSRCGCSGCMRRVFYRFCGWVRR